MQLSSWLAAVDARIVPCRRLSMLFARASTPNGRAILEQATEAKRDRVPDGKLHERVATLPTAESHVAGQIFPCKGDACPHMLPIPPFARGIGEDITGNQVWLITLCFDNCFKLALAW